MERWIFFHSLMVMMVRVGHDRHLKLTDVSLLDDLTRYLYKIRTSKMDG